MGSPQRDANPATQGLVFGLISMGIHAGARIYHQVGMNPPPTPKQGEAGLQQLLGGWVGAMQEIENLTGGLTDDLRTLQVLDLAATVFAILGGAYAAIAGHRGDRGAAMWLAWITSVAGLVLWAGQIPLGWRV